MSPHTFKRSVTLFCLSVAQTNAATFTVALDGTGDFNTIQAALDATAEGDIVEVADGLYTGEGNYNLMFPSWTITLRSANGPENCIIDGVNHDSGADMTFGGTIEGFQIIRTRNASGALICANGAFVINCIIKDNDIRGITFGQGLTHIRGCDISNNTAIGDGGGISCDFCLSTAHVIVEDCVISNNTAGSYGGAFDARVSFGNPGSATFRNCRIFGNHADREGGGLNINVWDVNVYDTIISQNTAGSQGGAVYIRGGGKGARLYTERCTIFDNSPSWRIFSNSDLVICNSIIRNDSFTIQDSPSVGIETNYSHIQNMDEIVDLANPTVILGPGILRADPLLSTGIGEAHLMPGSPAINAGNPDFTADAGEADFEGDPRVLYGRLDIGADEWFNPGDFDGDGDVDLLDFAAFQICYTGNETVTAFTDECVVFDADNDHRINLTDFAEFQLLFTGPM
jgi:hypothetical protein